MSMFSILIPLVPEYLYWPIAILFHPKISAHLAHFEKPNTLKFDQIYIQKYK
jgi:hypothetical protein